MPGASWPRRVRLLRDGKYYGQVAARETMGDIHFAQGVFDQAVREYEAALEIR